MYVGQKAEDLEKLIGVLWNQQGMVYGTPPQL